MLRSLTRTSSATAVGEIAGGYLCAFARHRPNENKISDRETDATYHEGKRWMVNTHEVDRRLSRGSLHRLVRRVTATRQRSSASSEV